MRRRVRATASRVRAAASLFFFFLAPQARKLSLSGSLGWAEGALKCHPWKGDGGGAIQVLSASSVVWFYPLVLVLFGRSSSLKNCTCNRQVVLAPSPLGYAVLCSLRVGAAGAPVAIR